MQLSFRTICVLRSPVCTASVTSFFSSVRVWTCTCTPEGDDAGGLEVKLPRRMIYNTPGGVSEPAPVIPAARHGLVLGALNSSGSRRRSGLGLEPPHYPLPLRFRLFTQLGRIHSRCIRA